MIAHFKMGFTKSISIVRKHFCWKIACFVNNALPANKPPQKVNFSDWETSEKSSLRSIRFLRQISSRYKF